MTNVGTTIKNLVGGFAMAALAAVAGEADARTASMRADGTLLVENQPFFPIGIYHVSYIEQRQGQELIDDLGDIAGAGFNLVIPVLDPEHAAALDAAETLGLSAIVEIYWPSAATTIDLLKSKPAVIGWSVANDFNLPVDAPEYPPAETTLRHDLVEGIDPQSISYMSGGSAPSFPIAPWAGTVDVIAAQSYQISNCYLFCDPPSDEWALQASMEFFDHAHAELGAHPFWANPQSFAFTGGRYPTPAESRNMVFGALVAGAKGIVYYPYYDDHGLLPVQAPALWTELQAQTQELTVLTPYLTDGVRTRAATGSSRVHAAYWQLGDEVVVVALNTDRQAAHAVNIDLPAGLAGPPEVLFPTRGPGGMAYTGGTLSRLSGSIAPLGVHVYRLTTACVGEDPICEQCVGAARFSVAEQTKRNSVKLPTARRGGVLTLKGRFTLPSPGYSAPDAETVTIALNDASSTYYEATVAGGGFTTNAARRRFRYHSSGLAGEQGIKTAKFAVASDGVSVRYSIKTLEAPMPAFTSNASSVAVRIGDACFVDPVDACESRGSGAKVTCR